MKAYDEAVQARQKRKARKVESRERSKFVKAMLVSLGSSLHHKECHRLARRRTLLKANIDTEGVCRHESLPAAARQALCSDQFKNVV